MSPGTVVVLIIVAAVIAAIIWKMARNKREGRTSCGCGCESCALNGQCHEKTQKISKK